MKRLAKELDFNVNSDHLNKYLSEAEIYKDLVKSSITGMTKEEAIIQTTRLWRRDKDSNL